MGGSVLMPDGLSPKERAFVEFYVGEASGNAKQALRLTGHVARSDHALEEAASRLLRKPEVTQAILVAARAVSEQTRRETVANEIEQREFLTAVMRGEIADVKVVRDDDGGSHAESVDAPVAERLKAVDQLAKRDGAYAADKAAGKQAAAAEKVAALLALAKGLKG